MRAPSAKALTERLNITPDQARTIRKEIHAIEYVWRPDAEAVDRVLETADRMLDGYGIEAIRDTRHWDRYYCDTRLLYVNMGDTYTPTLIYDTVLQSFTVGSWGDVVDARRIS